MRISQSALRDFYNPDYCKIKWEEVYINGNRTNPTSAMLDGLVFEQNVIGMSRGGEVYEIPKGKTGKTLKREVDLLELSEFAKETMDKLKIKLLDVQPEWIYKDLVGHPDALIEIDGNKAIMDLKYTGVREDESCKWNPFAWSDLENKDFTQAVHYVLMYYKMHGEILPFFYLVFGKSGWVKWISVDVSVVVNDYISKIKMFREDLKDFNPKGIGKYSICRKCPVLCNERVSIPDCQNITIKNLEK